MHMLCSRWIRFAVAAAALFAGPLPLWGQPSAGAPKPAPPAIDTPRDGDKKITGKVAYLDKDVSLTINGAKQQPVKSDAKTGGFTFDLKDPLKENQLIRVSHSDPEAQIEAIVQPSKETVSITINEVKEGEFVVTGRTEPAKANNTFASLRVDVLAPPDRQIETVAKDKVTYNDDGIFSATLSQRLSIGYTVRITALSQDGKRVGRAAAIVQSVGFEWGRARAYFTLGAQLSKNGGEFKNPDVHLGLTVDYNWFTTQKRELPLQELLSPAIDDNPDSFLLAQDPKVRELAMKKKDIDRLRERLNHPSDKSVADEIEKTSLDASLTKLKAKAGQANPADQPAILAEIRNVEQQIQLLDPKANRKPIQRRIREIEEQRRDLKAQLGEEIRGGTLVNTYVQGRFGQVPFTDGLDLKKLFQSNQAASVEGGIYVAKYFRRTSWYYRGQANGLYLAPLVKMGFQTIRQNTVQELTPEQAARLTPEDVYRYGGGGIRVGHYALSGTRRIAPQLISYLDVIVGRFDYFRLPRPGVIPSGGAGYRVPTRLEIQGFLKIPQSPFTVGFNTNVGSGPDDFRLFFGTRFDIGKILRQVIPAIQ